MRVGKVRCLADFQRSEIYQFNKALTEFKVIPGNIKMCGMKGMDCTENHTLHTIHILAKSRKGRELVGPEFNFPL